MSANVPSLWKKRGTTYSETLCGREISVVTYNTLADIHTRAADNPQCKEEFLFRKNDGRSERHRLLLEELKWLDADILCLQEIDSSYYNTLQNALSSMGYSGFFSEKTQQTHEGVAIFSRSNRFKIVSSQTIELSQVIEDLLNDEVKEELNGVYRTGHVLAMARINSLNEDYSIVIGNVHTQWQEWRYPVHITLQIAVAVQALERFSVSLQATNGLHVPYILCGDLNVEPHYPFYKLLSTGTLDTKDIDNLASYDYVNQYPGTTLPDKLPQSEYHLLDVLRKNFLGSLTPLQSAYKQVQGVEPSYTCVPHLVRQGMTLDYIWFLPKAIKAVAVQDVPEKSTIDPPGAIPSEHYPSDHVSLKTWLRLVDFETLDKLT